MFKASAKIKNTDNLTDGELMAITNDLYVLLEEEYKLSEKEIRRVLNQYLADMDQPNYYRKS